MTTDTQTYKIPEINFEKLQEQLVKLNKKALKLGSPEITLKLVRTETTTKVINEESYTRTFFIVEIDGISPKIPGDYTFVGTIEYIGGQNILRTKPSEEILAWYRTAKQACDHCGLNRTRNNTYIVHSEDEGFKQVGHNCVSDFLGHIDPKALGFAAEILGVFEEACHDGFSGSGGFVNVAPMSMYLEYVAELALRDGYVSRALAQKSALTATAGQAWSFMFPLSNDTLKVMRKMDFNITDQAKEIAKGAIEWLNLLTPSNTFEHNMKVLAGLEWIEYKHAGIAAFAVQAYRQDLVKKLEKKVAVVSSHVGVIGEKLTVKVLIKKHIPIEGHYATTHLYLMSDSEGNQLKWFSSRNVLEEAKQYEITGRVKGHDFYQDSKQTSLTRCKAKELS